jgi:membrane protein
MIRLSKVLFKSIKDYIKDDGVVHSAALSYFFILSIVPLCLFFIGIAGYVLGSDQEIFNFILERLFSVFPSVTDAITSELEQLIKHKTIALTSFALYAFLSFQLYSGVHKAMAAMFKADAKPSIFGLLVKPILLVSIVLIMLVLSFILTTIIPVLEKFDIPFVQTGLLVPILLTYVIPLLIVQFTALIVYVLVPETSVRVDDAFWGGFFTAIMLEAAKHLFTWYVGNVTSLGTMYGSLAVFVTFLLWMYYSWTIFLLGAEIVHNLGVDARVKARIKVRVKEGDIALVKKTERK